jgi:hypothetical protein
LSVDLGCSDPPSHANPVVQPAATNLQSPSPPLVVFAAGRFPTTRLKVCHHLY